MQTWTNIDKSEWPEGEWQGEYDKAQWVSSGLDCLIVRGPLGALCGYVGVPESHQYFGNHYDLPEVGVHGGLTFADKCKPLEAGDGLGVCHVEEGAANKVVWWLGFDCAHVGDANPMGMFGIKFPDETYRNIAYVQQQVERLAEQLG